MIRNPVFRSVVKSGEDKMQGGRVWEVEVQEGDQRTKSVRC